MTALIVAALLALAEPPPSNGLAVDAPGRTGLYGLGIGLELPLVGITSGAGSRSHGGWGYTLGAGLGFEVTPEWLVRLYVRGGESFNARAPVRYATTSGTDTSRQSGEWLGYEAGVGAAYIFRQSERAWAPYVGADVGATLSGFSYRFGPELAGLESQERDTTVGDCEGPRCRRIHDALGYGWSASLRSGVRLTMLRWLLTQGELSVSYAPVTSAPVENTFSKLEVRSLPESFWLVRATFGVRLAL